MKPVLYKIKADPERFALESIAIDPEGGTCQDRYRYKYLSAKEMKLALREKPTLEFPTPDKGFIVAGLTITSGEPGQRETIKRLIKRGTRNVPMKISSPAGYIFDILHPKADLKDLSMAQKDKERKKKPKRMERLTKLINEALKSLREELNLPTVDPVASSYAITEDVIASASTEVCKMELERLSAIPGRIYQAHFAKISADLQKDFPAEAKTVIKVFADTQTREHLSAMSLSTERSTLLVTLANIDGQLIKMEGWKFTKLLESPGEALHLETLVQKRSYNEPPPLLAFNHNKSGDVVAQFDTEESTLRVTCLGENKAPADNATFILDIDYALCIYMTLKRLRHDKERFDRLREAAEATIADDNPFKKMFSSQIKRGDNDDIDER